MVLFCSFYLVSGFLLLSGVELSDTHLGLGITLKNQTSRLTEHSHY